MTQYYVSVTSDGATFWVDGESRRIVSHQDQARPFICDSATDAAVAADAMGAISDITYEKTVDAVSVYKVELKLIDSHSLVEINEARVEIQQRRIALTSELDQLNNLLNG